MPKQKWIIFQCPHNGNKHWVENQYYTPEKILIVGDGKTDLLEQDIRSNLQDLTQNTRIDFMAHGGNLPDGKHVVNLVEDVKKPQALADIFKWVKETIGDDKKPQIHLWSCNSGAAESDFDLLPEGCTLFMHAQKDYAGSIPFMDWYLKISIKSWFSNNPLREFLDNILLSAHPCSIVIKRNNKTFSYLIPIQSDTMLSTEKVRKYFIDFVNDFETKVRQELGDETADSLDAGKVKHERIEQMTDDNLKKYSQQALFLNIGYKQQENVQKFLDADFVLPNIDIGDNLSVMAEAIDHNNLLVVSKLIEKGIDVNAVIREGMTALVVASKNGHTEIVKELTKAKANVDIATNDGMTPLAWASYNGYTEIIKELIKAKANVNIAANSGMTPLAWASSNGHTEIVEMLVEAKANRTIIELSAAITNKHTDVVRVLLSKQDGVEDFNPNITDQFGIHPIVKAVESCVPKIVQLMIDAGVDLLNDNTNLNGKTILEVAQNLQSEAEKGVDVELQEKTREITQKISDEIQRQQAEKQMAEEAKKTTTSDQSKSDSRQPIAQSMIKSYHPEQIEHQQSHAKKSDQCDLSSKLPGFVEQTTSQFNPKDAITAINQYLEIATFAGKVSGRIKPQPNPINFEIDPDIAESTPTPLENFCPDPEAIKKLEERLQSELPFLPSTKTKAERTTPITTQKSKIR